MARTNVEVIMQIDNVIKNALKVMGAYEDNFEEMIERGIISKSVVLKEKDHPVFYFERMDSEKKCKTASTSKKIFKHLGYLAYHVGTTLGEDKSDDVEFTFDTASSETIFDIDKKYKNIEASAFVVSEIVIQYRRNENVSVTYRLIPKDMTALKYVMED